MNDETVIPALVGNVSIMSNLTLEELGEILSTKLFGGLPFEGKDEDIHEEIPAIYIKSSFLGLTIILDGFSGMNSESGFTLYVQPSYNYLRSESKNVILDSYLQRLLTNELTDQENIKVL